MFKLLKEKLKALIKRKKEEVSEEKRGEKEEKKEIKEEKKVKKEVKERKEKIEKKEEKRERAKVEVKEKPRLLEKLKIGKIKISEEKFDDFFEELRLILWQNNAANEVVEYIEEKLKEKILGKEVKKNELEKFIRDKLKEVIREIFIDAPNFIELIKDKLKEKKPLAIVFFGINGSGKTTTIAKIAYLLKQNGLSCVFAASDTFRAASIEQIEKHAEKLGIKVIKHKYGSDPAAVAFDAIKYAKANGIDVVLIDTSGRMHTDRNLLEEMKKICRVNNPDLKIFVGEAIVGNDAIEQGKAFNDEIGIDGIILTKADVDEKGGAALSISYITKKPIFFLGVGQSYDDLESFDKEKILDRIFE